MGAIVVLVMQGRHQAWLLLHLICIQVEFNLLTILVLIPDNITIIDITTITIIVEVEAKTKESALFQVSLLNCVENLLQNSYLWLGFFN